MTTPELYLSLLSGRQGDVSHLSTEQRHNDVGSRLSGHPFPNDPDRLMDLLDALAAVCVWKEEKQVMFVSLSMTMDPKAATLYVSSNETVPATVTSHLRIIRGQLKELQSVVVPKQSSVVVPKQSIPPDIETSPDPSKTQARTEGELKIQKTIYEYSYGKLRQRFNKWAPDILAKYDAFTKSSNLNIQDATLLQATHLALKHIQSLLRSKRPPPDLSRLIWMIDKLSGSWQDHLNAAGIEEILTRWDNYIDAGRLDAGRNRKLSLRRLLKKLFTLHHHIRTIMRIAWSRRLSPFLDGQFDVVAVPAACYDISIRVSEQAVLPVIFPAREQKHLPIYDDILKRLQEKAESEGVKIEKGKLSMKQAAVHAECTLLAYHIQHPNIHPYCYFGGSKLSCHGCATFFSSYNLVAESFHLPQFFTKGSHNKIYLRWTCPHLLPLQRFKPLQPGTLSLDAQVKQKMIAALGKELIAYVDELRAVRAGPSPSQSDSTAASGDSREDANESLADLIAGLAQLDDQV